jgi:hypothetical protein
MEMFMMWMFGLFCGFIIAYIAFSVQINKLCTKIDEYYSYEVIDEASEFNDDDDDDWINDPDAWKRK